VLNVSIDDDQVLLQRIYLRRGAVLYPETEIACGSQNDLNVPQPNVEGCVSA